MSQVDLSRLRIDDPAASRPRRPRGPRLAVGAVALVGVALLASFLWPLLFSARPVRTAAVAAVHAAQGSAGTAASGAARAAARSTVAEAVGWVEADPFPIVVRPLIRGHVATLEVLEGAEVRAGETVIATLESAELLAARDRALAAHAEEQANVAARRAERDLAAARLQQNAEARLRERELRDRLAALETRLRTAQERQRLAVAEAAGARALVVAQERLEAAGTAHAVALERARAALDAAAASTAAAEREVEGLRAESAALTTTLKLARELVAEPVELRGALAVAEAGLAKAERALARAETELTIAEREFGWTTVTAPVDGVVLRLEARPGEMVGHGEKGLVALYDPQHLRARIDVPFDSLAGLHEGQAVEIRSEAIGDRVVAGVVQRIVHEADLLKNTLQVQVGLADPPRMLRPEMLCRARFLGADGADGAGVPAGAASVADVFVVPGEAVRDGAVFVVDPTTATARRVPVEVVGTDGERTRVLGALSPTQRVALDPVVDGERVQEVER